MKYSLLVSLAFALPKCAPKNPTVEIDNGKVVGVREAGTISYLGIPFAQPPVGALRLKAPVPLTLNGTVIAQKYGRGCVQRGYTDESNPVFSEDCLTLNVATPASGISNAPVIVYVYGGSFTSGLSADPKIDIRRFVAANPNVVFVSFNYRLGFLGFAASQELQAEQSLNLGLLDQKLAFEWVRKNIAKFGGDPNNVTAMGNSAGALALNAHLFSQDGSQKLFDRVIQLSGGPGYLRETVATRQPSFNQVAASLNCTTDVLPCLRSKSASEIFQATQTLGAGVIIDGTYITKQPLVSLKQDIERWGKIPQILFNDRDEGTYFAAIAGAFTPDAATNFMKGLIAVLGKEDAASILQLYSFDRYKSNQPFFDAASDLWGDVIFQCPTQTMSRLLSQSGRNVYSWINNFVPSFKYTAPITLGVFHTAELASIFDFQQDLNSTEIETAKQFRQAIVDFAYGKAPLAPNWLPYGTGDGNRYEIASATNIADNVRREKCDALLNAYSKFI